MKTVITWINKNPFESRNKIREYDIDITEYNFIDVREYAIIQAPEGYRLRSISFGGVLYNYDREGNETM